MSLLKHIAKDLHYEDEGAKTRKLIEKWESIGLLEGLDYNRKANVARLFENQAHRLLKEANQMSVGAVEGYATVAFPIVRRVFGDLIAQELISVQSMSRPNGLIFFLDFTKSDSQTGRPDDSAQSIYGGNAVGKQIQQGVDIGPGAGEEQGFYNLAGDEYSNALGESGIDTDKMTLLVDPIDLDGDPSAAEKKLLRYDVDLLDLTGKHAFVVDVDLNDLVDTSNARQDFAQRRENALQGLRFLDLSGVTSLDNPRLVRRLTDVTGTGMTGNLRLVFVADSTSAGAPGNPGALAAGDTLEDTASSRVLDFVYPIYDNLVESTALGSIVGSDYWGLEAVAEIPQISIKLDSVDIRTTTKKLKAVWTPELQQDLGAYHNTDAEAELTGILAEQIAREVDVEILNDLVQGATAGTYYWSRRPGKFVNRLSGADAVSGANESLLGADFTGNVSEWYQTLLETINDVSALIERKTLLGPANFILCGPEVRNILQFTAAFQASIDHDKGRGDAGLNRVGTLNRMWDVYTHPQFLRNVILIGRKGTRDFETGYVYAPYTPLINTPVIYDPEDLTPRKGVMTRYGKKMVRPDMYGLVIVQDMRG